MLFSLGVFLIIPALLLKLSLKIFLGSIIFLSGVFLPLFLLEHLLRNGVQKDDIEVEYLHKSQFSNKIYSGNSDIDRSIELLILLILKKNCSKETSRILIKIYNLIVEIINKFITVIKPVDWNLIIGLAFQKELLNHITLFMHALENVKKRTSTNVIPYEHSKVISEFFLIEEELCSRSYKDVCTDQAILKEKLTQFVDQLLFLLLDRKDYDDLLLRTFIVDLIQSNMSDNLLYVSQAENVNRNIYNNLKNSFPPTFESLLSAVKVTPSPIDVSVIKDQIKNYTSRLGSFDHMKDSEKDLKYSIKKEMSLLEEFEKACKIQIDSLNAGTMTIRVENMIEEEIIMNEMDEENNPQSVLPPQNNKKFTSIIEKHNLPKMSFDFVFNDVNGLEFFKKYLKSISVQKYIACYDFVKHLIKVFQPEFESKSYKSGIFLYRDPVLKSFRTEIQLFFEEFSDFMTKNNYHGFFEKIKLDSESNNAGVDILINFSEKLKNDINSNFYESFIQDIEYISMCVSMKYIPEKVLEEAQKVISEENTPKVAADYIESITITKAVEHQMKKKRVILYELEIVVKKNSMKEIISIKRRFKDFYNFYLYLLTKYPQIKKIFFPTKKAFGNLDKNFIMKRQMQLSQYLNDITLLQSNNIYFTNDLMEFFTKPFWEEPSLVSSLLLEPQKVTRSDTLQDNFDVVTQEDEKIPVKMINLESLMIDPSTLEFIKKYDSEYIDHTVVKTFINVIEEITNLKKSPWFKRQLSIGIKQFIKTNYGDLFSKKIMQIIDSFICIDSIKSYFLTLINVFMPLETKIDQNKELKFHLERLLAKSLLIGALPNECKKFFGEEFALTGIHMLFSMMQYKELNLRFLLIIIEISFQHMFPKNKDVKFHNTKS